ncbi:capsid protein [Vibrio phage C-ZP2022]|nr:capsid protein [Vibrio phage C-ZP2022]
MSQVQSPDLLTRLLGILKIVEDDRESIAEAADMASLTPLILTGNDLVNSLDTETIHNIYQFKLSMYTALWLKAASLILPADGVIPPGTSVEEILAPISDRRPRTTTTGALERVKEFITDITLEGYDDVNLVGGDYGDLLSQFDAENYKEAEISKPSNLAVGKLVYVPIRVGKTEIQQPITVRVKPNVVDVNFLNKLLYAFIGQDQSIMGRWNRFLAGEIEGSATYLLGLDILREDGKLRLEDKDGLYGLMRDNRRRGTVASIANNKKMNFNVASNMVVMSAASLRSMETAMRGSFSNPRIRDQFFDRTGTMVMSVVDPTMDIIKVYTVGQKDYGTYDLSDLKPKGSGGGSNDIEGMMKSFELGKAFNL